DAWRAQYGPVAAPSHGADDIAQMFSPNIYDGGATVLFALRQVIGDPAFQQLDAGWVQRYVGGPASTANFIALATEVSHRNLTGFLTAWLYGTKTPPMPGHPDWTVNPAASAAKVRRPARQLR